LGKNRKIGKEVRGEEKEKVKKNFSARGRPGGFLWMHPGEKHPSKRKILAYRPFF
jgi:hypothetical protein